MYATRNAPARLASDKQLAFINRLMSEKDTPAALERDLIAALHGDLLSSRDASRFIDALLACPRKRTEPKAPAVEVVEGFYSKGEGEDMSIAKVQRAVHGSGNLYAKRLKPSGGFEYEAGLIREIGRGAGWELLTHERAVAFGKLYGVCGVCGRTLTNEESIEAGIGPVCAGRL